MTDHTPFLTIFPGCADLSASCGDLRKAYVTEVRVNTAERSMTVAARFVVMPSPVELNALSDRLRSDYGLTRVYMNPDYPTPVSAPTPGFQPAASNGEIGRAHV